MPTDDSNKGLPIPYITAVWSGMTPADIEAGLANGSILPPMGAPAGWSPTPAQATMAKPVAQDEVTSAVAADAATGGATPEQVQGWLRAIDPSLSEDALKSIWDRAGATDAQRGASLQELLGTALLGDASADTTALDAFVADPSNRASVVDLSGKSGAELAELAATDIGYRQALAAMQPIAFTGNRALFAHANANGELDRFDPETGESKVSDAWLGDRAKMFAWNARGDGEGVIAGTQDWTFVDRAVRNEDGDFLQVKLTTGATNAGQNQVVFGSAESELLQGVAGSDRMYGGLGDDVLRGAGGADHLEGGEGEDLVIGGAGNDELAGDRGDDELDGGRGNDRLSGGSGSDVLVGGRGSDVMDGGAGTDTYAFDSGDGADTIVDADGLGTIELDGATIGGSMAASDDGTWASADGELMFSFAATGEESGNLTIRSREGDTSDSITVQGWKNGDLGITLASAPVAATGSGQSAESTLADSQDGSLSTESSLDPDAQQWESSSDVSNTAMTNANSGISWGDTGAVGAGANVADTTEATGDIESDLASLSTDSVYANALAAIFGSDAATLSDYASIAPGDVEDAVSAFDGVLEAPDVTATAGSSPSTYAGSVGTAMDDANAVTLADYADGLASTYDADDLGDESGSGTALQFFQVPDVKSTAFLAGTTPPVVKENYGSSI